MHASIDVKDVQLICWKASLNLVRVRINHLPNCLSPVV